MSKPLAASFENSTGLKVTFSFGSSGNLEQQSRQGAPFDVFAPAAASFSEALERDGLAEAGGTVYALGRLAAWSRTLPLRSIQDLGEVRVRRIAIANPQYAPYGAAAQQALEAAGLWETVRPKLVYGESVAYTYQMAASGNADVALVSAALLKDSGQPFLLIDPSLYRPIEQTAVVLRRSENKDAARAFLNFLSSAEARRILEEYGYGLP